MRALLVLLMLAGVARAEEKIKLHYDSPPHRESIALEVSLSTTELALHWRATGVHHTAGSKHKVQIEAAQVDVVRAGRRSERAWKRTTAPDVTTDFERALFTLVMAPRTYELSALGVLAESDAERLLANGVTRLPDEDVAPGATWTREWSDGWTWKQVVRFERIEERDGRRLAVLTSTLEGHGASDRCEGTTRVLLDVASGWIHEQAGDGTITTGEGVRRISAKRVIASDRR